MKIGQISNFYVQKFGFGLQVWFEKTSMRIFISEELLLNTYNLYIIIYNDFIQYTSMYKLILGHENLNTVHILSVFEIAPRRSKFRLKIENLADFEKYFFIENHFNIQREEHDDKQDDKR